MSKHQRGNRETKKPKKKVPTLPVAPPVAPQERS